MNYREELSLEDGLLLWRNRLIIPKDIRELMRKNLHEGQHPGVVAKKSLASLTVWWPAMGRFVNLPTPTLK